MNHFTSSRPSDYPPRRRGSNRRPNRNPRARYTHRPLTAVNEVKPPIYRLKPQPLTLKKLPFPHPATLPIPGGAHGNFTPPVWHHSSPYNQKNVYTTMNCTNICMNYDQYPMYPNRGRRFTRGGHKFVKNEEEMMRFVNGHVLRKGGTYM